MTMVVAKTKPFDMEDHMAKKNLQKIIRKKGETQVVLRFRAQGLVYREADYYIERKDKWSAHVV